MHEGKILKEENLEKMKDDIKRVQFAVEGDFDSSKYTEFNIIKCVKIGSINICTLTGNADDDSFNAKKDEISYKIINSDEMKKRKYYYLYDEENYNSDNLYCYVGYNNKEGIAIDNINIDEIREYLIKDINAQFAEKENAFEPLMFYNYDIPHDKGDEGTYYLQIMDKKNNYEDTENKVEIDGLDLYEFENTLEYLKLEN
ncbi:MAG: hypothetical protein WBJ13_08675 [Sedimentibacter sp.]